MHVRSSLIVPLTGLALLVTVRVETQSPGNCEAIGDAKFICGPIAAEDLVQVPQSEWVLASGNGPGGAIHAISINDRSTIQLFPTSQPRIKFDTRTYSACPGPLPAEGDKFRAHGLAIHPGRNGTHAVWAVHHGTRESVEAFEFSAAGRMPTLTWVGCVVSPDSVDGNGLTALPDRGFLLTNFIRRGDPKAREASESGGITGEVWEWVPDKGWSKLPGSELNTPNGVEVSKDGRTVYIAVWAGKSLVRLSRGKTPVSKDVANVDFRIDNVHWAPDGSLFVAGQGGPSLEALMGCFSQKQCDGVFTGVAKVDPTSLKVTDIIHYPSNPIWFGGTTALQVKNEIWVGTTSGNRIARFDAR